MLKTTTKNAVERVKSSEAESNNWLQRAGVAGQAQLERFGLWVERPGRLALLTLGLSLGLLADPMVVVPLFSNYKGLLATYLSALASVLTILFVFHSKRDEVRRIQKDEARRNEVFSRLLCDDVPDEVIINVPNWNSGAKALDSEAIPIYRDAAANPIPKGVILSTNVDADGTRFSLGWTAEPDFDAAKNLLAYFGEFSQVEIVSVTRNEARTIADRPLAEGPRKTRLTINVGLLSNNATVRFGRHTKLFLLGRSRATDGEAVDSLATTYLQIGNRVSSITHVNQPQTDIALVVSFRHNSDHTSLFLGGLTGCGTASVGRQLNSVMSELGKVVQAANDAGETVCGSFVLVEVAELLPMRVLNTGWLVSGQTKWKLTDGEISAEFLALVGKQVDGREDGSSGENR
jgi:hypothetical protein